MLSCFELYQGRLTGPVRRWPTIDERETARPTTRRFHSIGWAGVGPRPLRRKPGRDHPFGGTGLAGRPWALACARASACLVDDPTRPQIFSSCLHMLCPKPDLFGFNLDQTEPRAEGSVKKPGTVPSAVQRARRFINDLQEARGLYPGFFQRPGSLRSRLRISSSMREIRCGHDDSTAPSRVCEKTCGARRSGSDRGESGRRRKGGVGWGAVPPAARLPLRSPLPTASGCAGAAPARSCNSGPTTSPRESPGSGPAAGTSCGPTAP